MKHKYTISRDSAGGYLTVREFAELDKDEMSLLCEERYPEADITAALAVGRDNLVGVLRTRNMFPPANYAKRISEAIENIYAAGDEATVELVVDDKAFLNKGQADENDTEKIDEDLNEDLNGESDDLDGLLGDESKIGSSGTIKIAEDEPAGPDQNV